MLDDADFPALVAAGIKQRIHRQLAALDLIGVIGRSIDRGHHPKEVKGVSIYSKDACS